MASLSFLNGYHNLLKFIDYITNDNSTVDDLDETSCQGEINHQTFYLWLLLPGTLLSILLAFTQQRKLKLTDCLNGRPGLLTPQDTFSRSNRFSFAAAFGAIAYLCGKVILEGRYAIDYTGPPYLNVFVALLSMFLYGVGYFPLFASLAVNSVFGYAVGTLYAWMLATVSFYNFFYCTKYLPEEYALIVVRSLPEILCYLYLCFSLPVRFVLALKRKQFFGFMVDFAEGEDMVAAIRKSYQGLHVQGLFTKPIPPTETESKFGKVVGILKGLLAKILYKKLHGFRYSSRIMSIGVVSFCLLYVVVVELMIGFVPLFQYLELMLAFALLKTEDGSIAETLGMFGLRDLVDIANAFQFQITYIVGLAYYVVYVLKCCFIVSLTLAFVVGCVMILHSLSSYRNNLLDLYRGNQGHLTPKEEKSCGSLLVGCLRYAGYQVAYVAWGFFVQFIILFLVCFAISVIVTMIQYGLGGWLLDKFHNIWPVLLTTLVINFVQLGVAYFFFLQKNSRGEFVLRIDNRRSFFILIYFMFFYNIFVGLISCLLRVLKAIILGALFLPRLDHSTLPRKFQWFDPGFDAYCGFMHVESAHSHPVVMVFISILQAARLIKIEKDKKEQLTNVSTSNGDIAFKDITKDENARKQSYRARFKWHLAYTLVNNPSLLMMRKAELYRAQLLNSDTYVPDEKITVVYPSEEKSEKMAATHL